MTKPTIHLKVNDRYSTNGSIADTVQLVREYLGLEGWHRWRFEDYWSNQFIIIWEKLADKAVLMLLQHPDKFTSESQLYQELSSNLF